MIIFCMLLPTVKGKGLNDLDLVKKLKPRNTVLKNMRDTTYIFSFYSTKHSDLFSCQVVLVSRARNTSIRKTNKMIVRNKMFDLAKKTEIPFPFFPKIIIIMTRKTKNVRAKKLMQRKMRSGGTPLRRRTDNARKKLAKLFRNTISLLIFGSQA